MSFNFRWTGLDRSGHSCSSCGCPVTPSSDCNCCQQGQPPSGEWDVDLSGFTIAGSCTGTGVDSTCATLATTYTLTRGGTCNWLGGKSVTVTCDTIGSQIGDITVTLDVPSSTSTTCTWRIQITSDHGVPSAVIIYKATVNKFSCDHAMTLSYNSGFATVFSLGHCQINAIPTTITVTPA